MKTLPEIVRTAWANRDGYAVLAMKSWNPTKHPGVAAAALRVEEVYSGAERLA